MTPVGDPEQQQHQQEMQEVQNDVAVEVEDVRKDKVVIVVVDAKIYEGKASTYVKVKIGHTEHSTRTITNAQEPQWNEELVFEDITVAALARVVVELWSVGVISGDSLLAAGTVSLTSLTAGTVSLAPLTASTVSLASLTAGTNGPQTVNVDLTNRKGREEAAVHLNVLLPVVPKEDVFNDLPV